MTTVDLARWFAATRLISALEAVRRADAVVIRRAFKPRPGDVITLQFFSPPAKPLPRSPRQAFLPEA